MQQSVTLIAEASPNTSRSNACASEGSHCDYLVHFSQIPDSVCSSVYATKSAHTVFL